MLDRLGVGYERMREVNPGIVYCAISGYGQDGPKRDASGHDMNYLGLIGLLGLTGELGGEPVQAAGQIADLGGGALMAAFGIMAALARARWLAGPLKGSGEGQMVDVSMADGALSWLAMVAGALLRRRRGAAPRGAAAGGVVDLLPALRVRRRLGLAGSARAEVLAGMVSRGGREDLIAAQFERPGSAAHGRSRRSSRAARASSGRRSPPSTTAAWSRCWSSTRRLPQSSCARARWSWSSTSPVPSEPVRQLGVPVKLDRTPGDHARLPGPALGEHTSEVLLAAGYCDARWPSCSRAALRRARPSRHTAPPFGRERRARGGERVRATRPAAAERASRLC